MNTKEPVYPISGQPSTWELPDGTRRVDIGLTKIEYFTAMAMQGILANSPDWSDTEIAKDWVAKNSVEYAIKTLEQLDISKPMPEQDKTPMTEEELFEIYKSGLSNVDADGCTIDNPEEDFKYILNHILSQRKNKQP